MCGTVVTESSPPIRIRELDFLTNMYVGLDNLMIILTLGNLMVKIIKRVHELGVMTFFKKIQYQQLLDKR